MFHITYLHFEVLANGHYQDIVPVSLRILIHLHLHIAVGVVLGAQATPVQPVAAVRHLGNGTKWSYGNTLSPRISSLIVYF